MTHRYTFDTELYLGLKLILKETPLVVEGVFTCAICLEFVSLIHCDR